VEGREGVLEVWGLEEEKFVLGVKFLMTGMRCSGLSKGGDDEITHWYYFT